MRIGVVVHRGLLLMKFSQNSKVPGKIPPAVNSQIIRQGGGGGENFMQVFE